MLKERASGMYRLSAFYFARTASDVPMEVAVPSIFIIIIYVMAGLRPTAWAFFANWSAVVLTMLVAQSFGLLIGALVMVPKTAQTITAVVMLTMMLVGGFYVTNIPVWIAWLKVCVCVGGGGGVREGCARAARSPTPSLPPSLSTRPLSTTGITCCSRWEGSRWWWRRVWAAPRRPPPTRLVPFPRPQIEYKGVTLYNCGGVSLPDPANNPACKPVPPGGFAELAHLSENTERWPWEALALIGWLVAFRWLVYVALRVKTRSPT